MPGNVNSKTRKLELMAEIRRLCSAGYNVQEQLQMTGLGRRTYFRYLHSLFEHDRKLLEDQHSTETVMVQFQILIDRYNRIYRSLEKIADDSSVNAEQREHCLNSMAQLASSILLAYREGPRLPLEQKRKLAEQKQKTDSVLQQQEQRASAYSFPVSRIFDPNNPSPYTVDTSILTPEEQAQVQQEYEQSLRERQQQPQQPSELSAEALGRPPTEAEFQEIKRRAAEAVDRKRAELRAQGIDPDAEYSPQKTATRRDWWNT